MRTTVILILTLITTLAFGQSKEIYQNIGDSLMTRGQYDDVIKYFDNELKKYPKNEDVLRWLGYVHIAKNNLDLGEKYYNQALAVNPQCARCFLNIGKVYSLKGENKKALEYFNKAVNTDSKDALLYSYRANLKEMLGDKLGALVDHNKAIDIEPNNSTYYVQRGLYNSDAGYQSLAISDLTKAIELSPKNYYPYFQRASIYYSQQRLDEALKDINKAIELDSNQYSLYTGRGAIFDVKKEYKKAIEDYTKAISLNKTDYLPYLNRANSFYKLEDLDASCSDYLTLKALIENGSISNQAIIKKINEVSQNFCDSSKPSYYYQRGVGYYNLKEYHKALDIYTKGLAIFPNNGMMLSFKGNAYLALNEYKKAINFYNLSLEHKANILTEIKTNPKYTGASKEQVENFYRGSLSSTYLSISECKDNLGHFNEALVDINTALKLIPDIEEFNKEAYYNLRGHIYLMKGKFEQAILDFDKSIQINMDFPLPYVNRAIAKVSSVRKVKITSYGIRSNFNNQPMSLNWNMPNKSLLKKSKTNILSALSDCNMAIEIDKTLGFAYYIRGQIKQMLMYSDYCVDLFTAKELGLTVEDGLLIDCGK